MAAFLVSRAFPGLLVALAAFSAGAPGTAQALRSIDSPFHRVRDDRHARSTTVAVDETAVRVLQEQHARGEPFLVRRFALPGGESADLILHPVTVMEPGATALVVDERGTQRLAPSVVLFAGDVVGRASTVFLGISRELVHGRLSVDGETFHLRGVGREASIAADEGSVRAGAGFACGTFDRADLEEEETASPVPTLRQTLPLGGRRAIVREVRLALELDADYRRQFSSDRAALDYAVILAGATNEITRRDLGIRIVIPSELVRLWKKTPPWGDVTNATYGQALGNLTWWWTGPSNPSRDADRAIVHLLTDFNYGGGVAWGVDLTCRDSASYAISGVRGLLPLPIPHTSAGNIDLDIFAHENGHLFGSGHTFDAYVPPIACQDGSGPDSGTIMSYCYFQFGFNNLGMRYHARVQDLVRLRVSRHQCPREIGHVDGDYDGNGIVDLGDLLRLDAFRKQGFASRGAEDVLDLDRNGRLGIKDRWALLELLDQPTYAASALSYNGSGVNCRDCLEAQEGPMLGRTWRVTVRSPAGTGVPTLLMGALSALPQPSQTKFGELLIALSGFGGQTLFRAWATTRAGGARHAFPLPPDPQFLGLGFHAQAVMFEPTGPALTNALDLEVGLH
jgi:hypothetical protein